MTRYLLLGGNGFIGTNLAISLSSNPENEVRILSRSSRLVSELSERDNVALTIGEMSDYDSVMPLMEEAEVIMHLVSSSVPATSDLDSAGIMPDMRPMASLLRYCSGEKEKRIIFFSSSAVYGNGQAPFKEDSPTWPVSDYGMQKVAMEKLINLFRFEAGLDCIIVRPSNPYGPYQNSGIQGVIGAFISRALDGKTLNVIGDGAIERDFIFIDDLVSGIERIIRYEGDEFIFNLGSGKSTSIMTIAETIEEEIPNCGGIERLEGRKADARTNTLDMSRYTTIFGEISYTSLREGILRTIEYQRNKRQDN